MDVLKNVYSVSVHNVLLFFKKKETLLLYWQSLKFQIKLFRYDQIRYLRLDLSVFAGNSFSRLILVSPHYNYNLLQANLSVLGF